MKKVFIFAGIIFFILLVGAWVYLMLNGAPENRGGIFAQLGTNLQEMPLTEGATPDATVDISSSQRLKQLTTRPVGGAVFTEDGIRYMEQGTGHIYDIDLTTGETLLLSGTTILGATDAVFNSHGTYVAITSLDDADTTTIIAELGTSTLENRQIRSISLPPSARDIVFNTSNTSVHFLLRGASGSIGYAQDLVSGKRTELFTIPLRDVRVLWGTPTYVYTTPTASQTGHIFKAATNALTYVTQGSEGLIATRYGDGIIVTKTENSERTSFAIREKANVVEQSYIVIPEKCTADPISNIHIYCAVPANIEHGLFPDDWYAGLISFTDTLWRMDTTTGNAFSLVDFLAESGRTLDVKKIGADEFGARFYFINKNDNTLWMFDRNI